MPGKDIYSYNDVLLTHLSSQTIPGFLAIIFVEVEIMNRHHSPFFTFHIHDLYQLADDGPDDG